MPTRPPDLTAAQIAKLPPRASAYRVAPNLYLERSSLGAGAWSFRYQRAGKPATLGLGPLEHVSVAAAKARALELRAALFHGRDPATERRTAATTPRRRHKLRRGGRGLCRRPPLGLARARHRARVDADPGRPYRRLRRQAGRLVTVDDLLAALQPHWASKTSTMDQMRARIAAVLDYAATRGWRSGLNPAAWKHNLDRLLPAPRKVRPIVHRAAMDWRQLPKLYARLRQDPSPAALACRFTLLTATRRGEATGATWPEIDLAGRLWAIPAARTKAGRAHTVPLAEAALALLHDAAALRQGIHVFPSFRVAKAVNGSTVLGVMASLAPGSTVHGFRSGFRDWAAADGVPAELAEAALAHSDGAVVAAYKRDPLVEARRPLMESWARHLAGSSA